MKVTLVTTRSWEKIVDRFSLMSRDMTQLAKSVEDRGLKDWLDSQDVCKLLNISPRSLQNYRYSGRIGFTQINNKVFFSKKDIQNFINANKNR